MELLTTPNFWVAVAFILGLIGLGPKLWALLISALDQYITTQRTRLEQAQGSWKEAKEALERAQLEHAALKERENHMREGWAQELTALQEQTRLQSARILETRQRQSALNKTLLIDQTRRQIRSTFSNELIQNLQALIEQHPSWQPIIQKQAAKQLAQIKTEKGENA